MVYTDAVFPQTYSIDGRTVGFPVEVRAARMANAVYTVPAERAARVVPPPFEVVSDVHGAATVVIGFVDYLDNDLGDYDEVLWSVMARTADGEHEGTAIWRLPVNQPFTCEAGVRMLGLPKTLEDITIERDASRVTATLVADGALVMRQRFPLLTDVAPIPMPSPTVCLTVIGGTPARSVSEPQGGLRMAFGGDGYGLELGDHPWADELRRLGLEGADPTVVTVCDDWACSFLAPEPIDRSAAPHPG